MENINRELVSLIFLGILFVIIFLFDYIFIKLRYLKKVNGKKIRKNNELTEVAYLVGKFKLQKNKLPLNKLCLVFSLINAIIISLVAVVVLLVDTNVIIQLLIGFILLIALIYAIYELLGRFLERRGYGKNGK